MIALVAVLLATQDPVDTTLRWQAGAALGTEVSSGRTPWERGAVTVGWRTGAATVLVEQLAVQRFGLRDAASAAELYLRASHATTVYARAQVTSSARVLPGVDASLEATRALAGGWEVSAGGRLMHFDSTDVKLASVTVGRYLGPWYLRARGTIAVSAGTTGGGAMSARRYFRTVDDYLELSGSDATELVSLGTGLAARRTSTFGLKYRRKLGNWWGIEVAPGWTQDEGTPARYGLSAGAFLRW